MPLAEEDREALREQYKGALPPLPEDNNVYVSSQGSDETGDGTIDKPFATIGKALRGVNPSEALDLWVEHEGDDTLQYEHDRAAHLPALYLHTWIR